MVRRVQDQSQKPAQHQAPAFMKNRPNRRCVSLLQDDDEERLTSSTIFSRVLKSTMLRVQFDLAEQGDAAPVLD